MMENHQQQEKLLQKLNKVRKRIHRNRLIMVSILNFITFGAFFFAMAFYEWVWVHLEFVNQNDPYENVEVQLWANLLYMRQDRDGSTYTSFNKFSSQKCKNNLYCQAVFSQFSFVGYLCFFIFVIAGILQLYDFGKIFYFICMEGRVLQSKDNFRHIITISTYTIGITMSGFSVLIIDPNQYYFGVSFWIGIGTLIAFITIIGYEQYSLRKMVKQSLIQELIKKQKKIRAQQLKNSLNIQMSIRPVSQDDGLTL